MASPSVEAVFLFHRDLRLVDNTGLRQAYDDGYWIRPVFIFTPEQIMPSKNAYFSHPAVQFMCESLRELAHAAPLVLLQGDTVAQLEALFVHAPFAAFYTNVDNSVYALAREARIQQWCKRRGVAYHALEDYTLLPLRAGLVEDDPPRPYTVLAPFYRRFLNEYRAGHVPAAHRRPFPGDRWAKRVAIPGEQSLSALDRLYTPTPELAMRGGRRAGEAMLHRVERRLSYYASTRDIPSRVDGTSLASPHLKFGTVSIREMLAAATRAFHGRVDNPLVRELVFREFYHKIYALRPQLQRGEAYLKDIDAQIPWSNDRDAFFAWREGRTGFPLVDAGMRQLNRTGWMHNRVRMVVASFLTRYLLIDWRIGERYFAQRLVDVDPFSNTAGWGWSSGTGVDAMGYRPPLNPFRQSHRFDPDAKYIHRWVPELEPVPAKHIHAWNDAAIRALYPDVMAAYRAPIVDGLDASHKAVAIFRQAKMKASHLKR